MPKPIRFDDRRLIHKPAAEKFVPRLVTFSPRLNMRIILWLKDNPKKLSSLIETLLDTYLTEKGY